MIFRIFRAHANVNRKKMMTCAGIITAVKNASAKTKSTDASAKKTAKTTANAVTNTAPVNVKITRTFAKVCKIRAVRLFKPVQTEFWTGFSQNFAVDDIILLGIALLLLHDGTNDTLLLVIIAIVFLEGLT